jgi:hypothetical protein
MSTLLTMPEALRAAVEQARSRSASLAGYWRGCVASGLEPWYSCSVKTADGVRYLGYIYDTRGRTACLPVPRRLVEEAGYRWLGTEEWGAVSVWELSD